MTPLTSLSLHWHAWVQKLTSVQAEGKRYKLQIWDTAGQEKFRSISTMYFRGAHGVCLVFDLTNPTSFHNLKEVSSLNPLLHGDHYCYFLPLRVWGRKVGAEKCVSHFWSS